MVRIEEVIERKRMKKSAEPQITGELFNQVPMNKVCV